MPVLCGLIVFELALIIAGGVYAFIYYKNLSAVRWAALYASLAQRGRETEDFKKDFNNKFNAELVNKIDAVLKLGQNPGHFVVGQDGKLHKVNREY